MRKIITKIVLAFVVIIITLIYIGIRVYKNGQAVIATNQEIFRSYNIISLNKDIASQAKDMVLATRGFLLTEDSSYLKPYLTAVEKYPISMAKLEENAKARQASVQFQTQNINLHSKVMYLKKLFEARKYYTEQYIIVRQEKGINSAIALFQMQKNGNKIMDSIRQVTSEIETLETNWLQDKLSSREAQYQELTQMVFWLIGLITLTLALVIWTLSRDITGRIKAEYNLRILNQNLEQQVDARTKELKRSFEDMESKVKFRNLELEQQNHSLNKRITDMENNLKM
ncbi:MAG: CHASE3 domain-containing protein [Bacteroidia bacterium]